MIGDQDETILNWTNEAEAIIRDVKDHVNHISVSKKLKSSATEIFLNLKTLENNEFCIRASGNGFRIVADEFDKNNYHKKFRDDDDDDEDEETFETPYALLNKISKSYRKSFANQLMKQLECLEKESD